MNRDRLARLWPLAALLAGTVVVTLIRPATWSEAELLSVDAPMARASDPSQGRGVTLPDVYYRQPTVTTAPSIERPGASSPQPSAAVNTWQTQPAAVETSAAKTEPVQIRGVPATRSHAAPTSPTSSPTISAPTKHYRVANRPEHTINKQTTQTDAVPQPLRVTESANRTEVQPQFAAASCWPRPVVLIDQLTAISQDVRLRAWAEAVLMHLNTLPQIDSLEADQAGEAFAKLRALVEQGRETAKALPRDAKTVQLKRALYALTRRLDIWEPVHRIARPSDVSFVSQSDGASVAQCAAKVDALLGNYHGADAWRKYLQLQRAKQVATDSDATTADQRKAARSILARINSSSLNEAQRQFFDKPDCQAFVAALESWAAEPVFYPQLLRDIEYHERGWPKSSSATASNFQALRWSANPDVQALAEQVNIHYRNANLRIAVSEQLINRLMPEPDTVREGFQDRIRGANVIGDIEARPHVRIRLLPDRQRIRFGVEASGEGESTAEAHRSGVVVGNEGVFRFRARKLLTVDRRGVHVRETETEADSDTYVTGIASNFDGVPILGPLTRSIARNQANNEVRAAEYEAERRLKNRIGEQLDSHVSRELEKIEQDFATKWLNPLKSLKLNPVVTSMQTTQQRMIVRYRLAGAKQLAAHTPRPLAMSDSWLSMQIHESSINNIVDQLLLDGRTFTLEELHRKIAETFGGDADNIPEDLPPGVTVTFAADDPIRMDFDEGRVRITLRIKSLTDEKRGGFRTFSVSANYVPDPSTLQARFIRDTSDSGYIDVDGIRKVFHKSAVVAIFSSVFSVSQPISIMPKDISQDPRLAHLHVSQFEVTDGWIGFALAPKRDIDLAPSLRTATRHESPR